MNNLQTGRDRYRNDPQFKALVDMMVGHIRQLDVTPSEMRDAAMTASIIVELTTARRLEISVEADRLRKVFPEL